LIGPDDVRAIGRPRIELVRDDLDRKIARSELSWKTAANVWTAMTKMFDDAMASKKAALRVRDDNPCRDVKPPDRGARKAKQWLYPSEFLAFVSCPRIPMRWRRAVAVAVCTYVRGGELRALQWDAGDVDLTHGVLSITRAYSQGTKRIEQTKTGETRRFAIEPNLLPMLGALHEERKGKGPVLSLAPQRNTARKLRRYLKVAGVTRPELHEGSPTRKPLTWHDLRATGITWMAIRGDDPLKIKQRAGHMTLSTTERYIRQAEAVREGFGDVFPELPECLGVLARVSVSAPPVSRNPSISSLSWRRERDSNPRYPCGYT
jgi:integrase